MVQMLDLADFKACIINTAKELKENIIRMNKQVDK